MAGRCIGWARAAGSGQMWGWERGGNSHGGTVEGTGLSTYVLLGIAWLWGKYLCCRLSRAEMYLDCQNSWRAPA